MVGSRHGAKLLDGMRTQVDLVRSAREDALPRPDSETRNAQRRGGRGGAHRWWREYPRRNGAPFHDMAEYVRNMKGSCLKRRTCRNRRRDRDA